MDDDFVVWAKNRIMFCSDSEFHRGVKNALKTAIIRHLDSKKRVCNECLEELDERVICWKCADKLKEKVREETLISVGRCPKCEGKLNIDSTETTICGECGFWENSLGQRGMLKKGD